MLIFIWLYDTFNKVEYKVNFLKIFIDMKKRNIVILGVVLILAVIFAGGFLVWRNQVKVKISQKQNQIKNEERDEREDVSRIEFKNCNISLEKKSNHKVKELDPFKEEFDTSVCGYKIIKNETAHVVIGGYQKNIYFRVTEFADEKFKESLLRYTNNVSVKKDESYIDIGIGCLIDNQIKGILQNSNKEGFYLEKSVGDKIINSSENNQVALNLLFRDRPGSGCVCCSLPYDIEIIEK